MTNDDFVVSVTERGAFKRCRRQWDYTSKNRQNLAPIISPTPLFVGKIVHATLADWTQDSSVDLKGTFYMHAATERKEIAANYLARIGTEIADEELDDWYEGLLIAEKVVLNYVEHYKTPLPPELEVIEMEKTVKILIPGTNNNYLEGTFDGLLRHNRTQELFILERKTYARRPNDDFLQTNDQFLAYHWLASKMGLGKVAGLLYDGMWKKEVTDKRPLSDLFYRKYIIRPQEELNEFGEYLWREIHDMQNPRIYLNRRWEGCYDCSFSKLCTAQSRGEDIRVMKETMYVARSDNK